MTYRLLFPQGCRSDRGLVEPIIRRLKEDPDFEVEVLQLSPMNFVRSYVETEIKIKEFKPDLVFINADRVEMAGACHAAFFNKVKIAHYQGGVVNYPITTFDDILRHNFTLMADVHFVESMEHSNIVYALRSMLRLSTDNIHIVGITHLDDLSVDESKVPVSGVGDFHESDICTWSYEPYDLILLNPEPLGNAKFVFSSDIINIQIGCNPDGESEPIPGAIYYPNLPRPQFLGLLKNCQRFITNSSCAITEAPYFLKPEQIVMVGDRNRNRPPVECKPGGSDRIVEILKEYANAYN